jgi:tetratricopeptide (TPR) repeat protein
MALLALALFLAQSNPCTPAADAFRRGDLASARTLLNPTPPQTSFCLKLSGLIHAASGDYRSAVDPFAASCRLNRNEPDACYFWARALYALDRFEDSLAALAAPSATKSWKLLTARGQALDALGRPTAEPTLRRALSQRSSDPDPLSEPDPLLALASFLHRQGRAAEALALLTSAPAPYHRFPSFHYQAGRAHAQAQRWPDAAEALKNAISLDPNHAEAHGLLSRVYYRLNQPDLAALHARRATQGSTTSK